MVIITRGHKTISIIEFHSSMPTIRLFHLLRIRLHRGSKVRFMMPRRSDQVLLKCTSISMIIWKPRRNSLEKWKKFMVSHYSQFKTLIAAFDVHHAVGFLFDQDQNKLYEFYATTVLQRRLWNNVFRRKLQQRLQPKSPHRRILAWLFSPYKAKVKALRMVSQLTGLSQTTVSTVFNSPDPMSTQPDEPVIGAPKSAEFIPRIDPDRFEWLIKWIDQNVPVKSGTDHRILYGTWQFQFHKYTLAAKLAHQKVRTLSQLKNFFIFIDAIVCFYYWLQPVGYKVFRKSFIPFHVWHVNYWWFICPYCHRLNQPGNVPTAKDTAHERLKKRQFGLLDEWKEKQK